MDWSTYKTLCEKPDYFSRWTLLKTQELCEESTRGQLKLQLQNPMLEKPPQHKGDDRTDFFRVSLSRLTVVQVLRVLKNEGNNQTGQIRHLGSVWQEYSDYLDKGSAASTMEPQSSPGNARS